MPSPTSTARVRAHRKRAKAAGLIKVEVSVPAPAAEVIRLVARILTGDQPKARQRLLRYLAILRAEVIDRPEQEKAGEE